MGISGISVPQLLIVLVIVLLVFGTARMKSLGSDLGGAIRGFRRAMEAEDDKDGRRADGAARRRRIGAAQDAKSELRTSERTDDEWRG